MLSLFDNVLRNERHFAGDLVSHAVEEEAGIRELVVEVEAEAARFRGRATD